MQKFEIAKVLKPQGIRGEIKVECFISDINFLKKLKTFEIENKIYNIKSIRSDGKYAYILTQEIADRNMAETLRNKTLIALKPEANTEEHEYFISDLVDCCVVDELNNIIGFIDSVEKYTSTPIINLMIGGMRKSFPFLERLLKDVDIQNKKIVVYKDKIEEVLVWKLMF